MGTSRFPGFYKLTMDERAKFISEACGLNKEEQETLSSTCPLPRDKADNMIENALGIYPLPYGIGLNFMINGKDYVVPMAIEEPSVIASASHIAKIVREAGGFQTESTDRLMIGQIQIVGCEDTEKAKQILLASETELLEQANETHPGMTKRGGGAKSIEVRELHTGPNRRYQSMLVLHLMIDTCDAMGANTINTMVETIAPTVEKLTGGKVYLRILSNFTDQCLARAKCVIPPDALTTGKYSGEEVRDGVIAAYEFADSDPYRAVTHNKGVMNGIDAVVMATGNDWRAIEAASHAYAARDGHYRSMTKWSIDEKGRLVGFLELPMPVGIVGGSIGIHPMAQLSQKLLEISNASKLAEIIVAVGLAQNLGALKALVTDGIQKGHMALHARSVAMAAGAEGELIDEVTTTLQELNDYRLETAKQILERMFAR